MEALTEAPMSLGERFRAVREERGLTVSEIAEHIRIRSVYLTAIEDETWSVIGAPVYARGFIRTYARFLGLDPEEAVAAFNASPGAAPPPAPAVPSRSSASKEYREPPSLSALIWIAGAVAAVLIGFVIYLFFAPPRGASTVAANSPAASVSAQPAVPLPSSSPPLLVQSRTLAIHLTAASWLRVSVDGNVTIEGTFPAGTDKSFHGKSALVRIGNAGGVEITVDGKPIGKLGGPGDVVERSFAL